MLMSYGKNSEENAKILENDIKILEEHYKFLKEKKASWIGILFL
jgi:hypothetical protein